MEDEKFTITLTIAGEKFPTVIKRSDEELYRNATKLIDKKLNFYRNLYGPKIAGKEMQMVALNLAVNLVKTENLQDAGPVFDRLEQLDKEVQDLLKK